MIIKYCTLNGVDEAVDIDQLNDLSVAYPFIEWGVLVDGYDEGTNRFPSRAWIEHFNILTPRVNKSLQITCGRMEDIAETVDRVLNTYPLSGFQRIMFSFDMQEVPYTMLSSIIRMAKAMPWVQFVTQHNGNNQAVWKMFAKENVHNHSILFDTSNITGTVPEVWPVPIAGILCGYCGGLSPSNIEENLSLISSIVGEGLAWIDMATGIRNDQDQFDILKAEQCAVFASKYTI